MKRTEIEHLLPEVFRVTLDPPGPLSALLDAMAALHAPIEATLDEIDAVFDPARTEDRFVPMLAKWVDLERLFVRSVTGSARAFEQDPISTGMGRLRELVACASELSQWRGTRKGLIAFLETATGIQGFDISEQVPDEHGRQRPFHIRVYLPPELDPVHRPLVERIIEFEKPAYVTYDIDTSSLSGQDHGTPV